MLRGLMAELERIANHLGDIGAICNDAAFALMHAHTGVLRESVLRAANAAFGHRLMMDCVIPGGVAADLEPAGRLAIQSALAGVRQRLPLLIDLYDDTASLQDRTVGTGVVKPQLIQRFAAGGYVGRAAGRAFDARKAFPYPPYDALWFDVPVRERGDVDARVWVRFDEIGQSLRLIEQILAALPDGPLAGPLPMPDSEGVALVESFRGDLFAWVRLEGGLVRAAHLRDPSWFQWPLLEAAIEDNIVADFPLCNKSFNCSYAGVDL
jgi:Ni,Fe-hydrogenase III large subunit